MKEVKDSTKGTITTLENTIFSPNMLTPDSAYELKAI